MPDFRPTSTWYGLEQSVAPILAIPSLTCNGAISFGGALGGNTMGKPLSIFFAGAVALAPVLLGPRAVAASDAFVCYTTRGAAATAAGEFLDAADKAATRSLCVGRAATLCAPADTGDE